MTYYGARHLADSFRTVRANTIILANEIPAEQYGFSAAPGLRTVGQQFAHIAVQTPWQIRLFQDGVNFIDFERFGRELARNSAEEALLQSKAEIIHALEQNGEAFASFVAALTEEQLAFEIGFPPPVKPSVKSRFELLLGVKEHEMHHRAQLMLIQRLLGMVPHLTRQREAMAAQAGRGN